MTGYDWQLPSPKKKGALVLVNLVNNTLNLSFKLVPEPKLIRSKGIKVVKSTKNHVFLSDIGNQDGSV